MFFNIWTCLLFAFLSQSVLLILFISVKAASNTIAKALLNALLAVILLIQLGNICEASYLYRKIHGITECFRGLGLLLGPLLYGYTLSLLTVGFKLKRLYLLHGIPYLLVITFVYIQDRELDRRIIVLAIDAVMNGTMRMTLISSLWFIGYFVHLAIYFILTLRLMVNNVSDSPGHYILSMKARLSWLKKILILFGLLVLMYLGIVIYVLVIGYYSVTGNFIYSMLLGCMIYIVAWQTYLNVAVLNPHFDKRYRSITMDEQSELVLLKQLVYFFEDEKIFLDPDIRINSLAKKLDTTAHILSKIINERLGKNFSELINQYRIEEAKKRMTDPAFAHLSIMGIAMDVGFTSKSAFNESFKKQNGLTPSAYLKQAVL